MSPTLQIGHQHHILAYSYVGDRLACHQHKVTNITMSPTSLSPQACYQSFQIGLIILDDSLIET